QTMIATHRIDVAIANERQPAEAAPIASQPAALARTLRANTAVIRLTMTIITILAQKTGVTNSLTGSAIVCTAPVSSNTTRPPHIQGTRSRVICDTVRLAPQMPRSRRLIMMAEVNTMQTLTM